MSHLIARITLTRLDGTKKVVTVRADSRGDQRNASGATTYPVLKHRSRGNRNPATKNDAYNQSQPSTMGTDNE